MIAFVLTLFFAIWATACDSNHTPEITPDPTPTPEVRSYSIGDLYDNDGVQGLVFRVNEAGDSGLIVSLTEPDNMLAWGTEFITTGSNVRSSGQMNTEIIYTLPNWEKKYPAFAWCKSLGEGWYIPSVNELRELLIIGSSNTFRESIIKNKATAFSAGKYLSSTEMDDWWVYLVDAATTQESANYKQYIYRVRAIYQF